MVDLQEFGERIREARLEKGMSLGQLASAVGRSSSSLRRWERGEVVPADSVIAKLTAILEIEGPMTAAPPIEALEPSTGVGGEDEDERVSTVEQPILAPSSGPAYTSEFSAVTTNSGDVGRLASFWIYITRGSGSWIGWIRGFLTAGALVLMLFVLIWAVGELSAALGDVLDSFSTGSTSP